MTKEYIANKILELIHDFEVIKGLRNQVTEASLGSTLMNLQDYEILKTRFFAQVNQLQLDSLQVMSRMQYVALRSLIQKFHKEL